MEIFVQSFGARLRTRGGLFVLTITELSGKPDSEQVYEYAPHQVETILIYSQGGSISGDALQLALQHKIDILVFDQLDTPLGRLFSHEPSASVLIQKAQLHFAGTPQGLEFAREWLGLKIRRKMVFLERLERYRDGDKAQLLKTTRQKLAEQYNNILNLPLSPLKEAADKLRGHEGTSSHIYFDTLSKLLPAEYRFNGRSRGPALDLFNAFLNYGYGILYSLVETELVKVGLNPWIGFHHSMERGEKALVFDFIEAYRPWMDQLVFLLCSRKHATTNHLIAYKGGWWLSQRGKALLVESFHQLFDKKQWEVESDLYSQKQMLKREAKAFALAINRLFHGGNKPVVALLPA